jgi:hypothetical protein
MKAWLRDRMRHPKRTQIKIRTERVTVGRLHIGECQVRQAVRLSFTERAGEANLSREEALQVAGWLKAWAESPERNEISA